MTSSQDTRLFEAPGAENGTPAERLCVRDLCDGQAVEGVFIVRDRELRARRSGEDFLTLTLGDATGTMKAVCWDEVAKNHQLAASGAAVQVRGRFSVHERYGRQLKVDALAIAEPDQYRLDDLVEGPPINADQMERDLQQLIATVQNPFLRRLLDDLFGERAQVWQIFRVAPAAKFYHQAYAHGLLEHTLGVAQAVSAISASFPGVDRDLAVTGALVHDIGKIEAYEHDPLSIDLTDDGRLLGEIPLGYYMVRRRIDQIDGFPWDLARALLHIQLSHHGTHENGSPVLPCTREATIVHSIDNLGGKLGSFDRLQKELRDGESWSGFDRALAASAYFASANGESENGAVTNGVDPVKLAAGE